MPYKNEYEWSIAHPGSASARKFLQISSLHGAHGTKESTELMDIAAREVTDLIAKELEVRQGSASELQVLRTMEQLVQTGNLWGEGSIALTVLRQYCQTEQGPLVDLIRRMTEALRIFNGHDANANLKNRYGEEWWNRIEALVKEGAIL